LFLASQGNNWIGNESIKTSVRTIRCTRAGHHLVNQQALWMRHRCIFRQLTYCQFFGNASYNWIAPHFGLPIGTNCRHFKLIHNALQGRIISGRSPFYYNWIVGPQLGLHTDWMVFSNKHCQLGLPGKAICSSAGRDWTYRRIQVTGGDGGFPPPSAGVTNDRVPKTATAKSIWPERYESWVSLSVKRRQPDHAQ
jgi:hypothetical protein